MKSRVRGTEDAFSRTDGIIDIVDGNVEAESDERRWEPTRLEVGFREHGEEVYRRGVEELDGAGEEDADSEGMGHVRGVCEDGVKAMRE